MFLLFADGNINVTVTALNPQEVGQILIFDCIDVGNLNISITEDIMLGEPLILRCVVNTMTTIADVLTFVWSSNNTVLRRVNQTKQLHDHYVISQLNTSNDGQEYMCEVIINSIIPERVNGIIKLSLTGKSFTNLMHTQFL